MRVKVEYCFPELQIPRNNKGQRTETQGPNAQSSASILLKKNLN